MHEDDPSHIITQVKVKQSNDIGQRTWSKSLLWASLTVILSLVGLSRTEDANYN